MPSEQRSCVGCHESRADHGATPDFAAGAAMALRSGPDIPERPAWTADGRIDYRKHIQPVWDRHCTRCHGGPRPEGYLDLTGDRTRFFSVSYDSLLTRELVDWQSVAGGDSADNSPKTLGSAVSRLCGYLEGGGPCGVVVPPDERKRVFAWIDANVPFRSTYVNRDDRKGGYDAWYFDDRLDASFQKRCAACHQRVRYNQAMAGGWATVHSDRWSARGISANNIHNNCTLSARYGPDYRINLGTPEHSAFLLAPLSRSAGGWQLCETEDGKPVFADEADPDYRVFLENFQRSKRLVQRADAESASR